MHTRGHVRHGKAVSRHIGRTSRCHAVRLAGGLAKVRLLLLLLLQLLHHGKRQKGVKRGKDSGRSSVRHALELACIDGVQHGQARGHAAEGRQVDRLRQKGKGERTTD